MKRIIGFLIGISLGFGIAYLVRRVLTGNNATPATEYIQPPTEVEQIESPAPAANERSTAKFTVRRTGPRPQSPTAESADSGSTLPTSLENSVTTPDTVESVTPSETETPSQSATTSQETEVPGPEAAIPLEAETSSSEISAPLEIDTPTQEFALPLDQDMPTQKFDASAIEEAASEKIVTPENALDDLSPSSDDPSEAPTIITNFRDALASEHVTPPTPRTRNDGKEDLAIIYDLGPISERKLFERGITTFEHLSELSIEEMAEITGIAPSRIERGKWKENAGRLAKGLPMEPPEE